MRGVVSEPYLVIAAEQQLPSSRQIQHIRFDGCEISPAKTTAEGILLAHISNRYMDLAPVLRRLKQSLNLVAYIQNDFNMTSTDSAEGKSASRWVVLARREKDLAPFLVSQRWQRLDERSTGDDLWTDDFTNLLRLINWR